MHRMIEITDLNQLEDYHQPWELLLAETRGACFFHSFDWLVAYWQRYGHNQKLRVLIVERNDQILGIVPLVVRRERTRAGVVRVLTYPLDDWGPFYSPISPVPLDTLGAALGYVRESPRDWDLLDLRWIDRDGSDQGTTCRAMRDAGFAGQERIWKELPVIETTTTWSEYLATRSSKFRRNILESRNRLNRVGQVEHVRYRPTSGSHGGPRWDLYDACVTISEHSWQGSAETGTTLSTASVRQFFRTLHELAARRGNVDLNLLLLDKLPIAYCYNYHSNGCVAGVRMGYDPRFARFSPGCVLQSMQIEDSITRGDRMINLAEGYQNSKKHWATGAMCSYRTTYYAKTAAKAQLLRAKHWFANTTIGTA